MRFPPIFQPFFAVKSIFTPFVQAALLLFSLNLAATAQSSPPVIERQPYRILYNTDHDPVGEWPPIGINPPRVDASSLVNIGCAIDLRIVASGNNLTYQWKKSGVNIPGATNSTLFVNVTSLLDAGRYQCEVKNVFGGVLSLPVRMGVVDISSTNYFVAAAGKANVTMDVSVKFPTTTGGFKYRWYKMLGANPNINTDEMLADDGIFSGATKPKLSVKVPSADVAGSYYCMVTAYNTYMLAGLHHLAVVPAPEPAMVQLGAPMNFSVTPVGPAHLLGGLEYQWLKNAGELPGETNASYSVASAGAGDAGLYSVSVTHPTLDAVTTPQVAGLVIDEPVSHVLAIATGTTSLVAPAPVSTAQTFQWFRNGNPIPEAGRFTGTTKAKLGIKDLQVADAGDYECRGTLYGDTVVVARPVLIVLPAPLSQVAALGGGFELEGLAEYDSSLAVNAGQFDYQWIKGKDAVAGATASTFSVPAASLTDVSNYCLQLNYPGATAVKSKPAAVAVVDTAPITVNVNAGKSTKLKPVFTGRGVSFQWRRGGLPIEENAHYVGVSKNTLSIVGATLADAGDDYECVISYPGGSSVAAPFEVVVYSRPEFLNLEFPPAIVRGAFNYQIEVSDDPLYAATGYNATPLPKGLVINKLTGVISGVPSVSGTFNVAVSAINAVGTTTQMVPLTVSALPSRFVGRFVAALPRMPAGEFGELGGRLDMNLASTGAASGNMTVGGTRFAFTGSISVSGTDPLTATASATINVVRSAGNLTLGFNLFDDDYLYDGRITGAGNTLDFSGWRATYTVAEPPSALAGTYNIALSPEVPELPLNPVPEGTGYAALSINGSPLSDLVAGNYTMAVALPDDTGFTTAAFVGPAGELLAYSYLYGTLGGGSVVSTGTSLNINALALGRPVAGELTWTRPANMTRRYKNGFIGLGLTATGGLYAAGDRLLAAQSAQLTFEGAGIDLASRNPDAGFAIGLGTALPTRTALNDALTVFKGIAPITGLFNGSFALADDNPTTALVNPREYARAVNFKGMAVPINGTQVGVGFFILPQIPTLDPLTTTRNSPELSGSVLLEPAQN